MRTLARFAQHPLFVVALFFGAWEAVARTGLVAAALLPPLTAVIGVLVELLQRPTVWMAIAVTAGEVLAAFAIALPLGVAIGLALSESRFWGAVFRPVFQFLFSIPKSVFLPMFILAIGIGIPQKIAYGVFSMIFIVVISMSAAVESVRGSHLLVARCYGATRAQVFRHVYLPSMLPALLETVRLGMIFNFTGVILAEMYVSQVGIGKLIGTWGENYQLPQLLAGILLVSAAAVLFNESIRVIETKYGHWRQ
ncbi:ABC transporter permease [Ramlibacter sp.]|uniref:ABC transporter permease n=1 Tax=Ramlibacter sp. TaxID=1917967 RepID=UPI002FCB3246